MTCLSFERSRTTLENSVLSADLVTFARTKGLFGGISLEGAVIAVRDESNEHYYGKSVRPTDILMKRTVENPQAAGLRAALARATGEKPSTAETIETTESDQQ
jgi:SH3 domain-containing YSC84-like protein 1